MRHYSEAPKAHARKLVGPAHRQSVAGMPQELEITMWTTSRNEVAPIDLIPIPQLFNENKTNTEQIERRSHQLVNQ